MNGWLGIAGVGAALGAALGVGRWVSDRLGLSAELSRKWVHVAMGVICAGFPWVFAESWPVWVLAGLATLGLVVVRVVPGLRAGVGAGLHGVERWSVGELLFAPAVALVFELADGASDRYVAAILVLALADAAGALAGTRWGKARYRSGTGWKSVEGSVVFLAVAVGCVAVPLHLGGDFAGWRLVLAAMILGLFATAVEGASDKGGDNLLLPLTVFFLIGKMADVAVGGLVLRFGVLVGLLGMVAGVSRMTTLGGGGLLAAALLGYGLAVLGGTWFVVPVLMIFGIHLVTTWRRGLLGRVQHGREPVLGVAMGTLPWAAAKPWLGADAALAGCAVGAAVMLWIMQGGTRRYLEVSPTWSVWGGVQALIVAAVAVFPGTPGGMVWMLVGAGLLAGGVAGVVALRLEELWRGSERGLWLTRGVWVSLPAGITVALMTWM